MSAWGGGGVLVTMPTTPWPAEFEIGRNIKAAANENPFTGQQQIQDWQYNIRLGSCTLPPMAYTDGQNWQFFLDNCNGPVNVFQFMPDFASDPRYYFWMTANNAQNGPQKYWRLLKNDYHVKISPGGIYTLTFEFREAS